MAPPLTKTALFTGIANTAGLAETSVLAIPPLAAGETVLLTPASSARVYVLTAAGIGFLCSFAAGAVGDVVTLVNGGVVAIALGHEEGPTYGGAVLTDCFFCPDLLPYILRPGAAVDLRYGPWNGSAANRWNVIGVNTFAPNGYLSPMTPVGFQEQTAFVPNHLWPCDDKGPSADDLREACFNAWLAHTNAPLTDWRMQGYRGVQITEAANGYRNDVSAPGVNSLVRGLFFGQATPDAAENLITGRFNAVSGIQSTCKVLANGHFTFEVFDGGVGLRVAEVPLVVNDATVRLGLGQCDKAANETRARVSMRGAAPVASPDIAGPVGDLSGGAGSFNYVGGTAGTGAVALTFASGVFEIIGATAEGASVLPKLAHRLGAE